MLPQHLLRQKPLLILPSEHTFRLEKISIIFSRRIDPNSIKVKQTTWPKTIIQIWGRGIKKKRKTEDFAKWKRPRIKLWSVLHPDSYQTWNQSLSKKAESKASGILAHKSLIISSTGRERLSVSSTPSGATPLPELFLLLWLSVSHTGIAGGEESNASCNQ